MTLRLKACDWTQTGLADRGQEASADTEEVYNPKWMIRKGGPVRGFTNLTLSLTVAVDFYCSTLVGHMSSKSTALGEWQGRGGGGGLSVTL